MSEWIEYKKNLKLLCANCQNPAGLHGAHDGQCPHKETKFKPYRDNRCRIKPRRFNKDTERTAARVQEKNDGILLRLRDVGERMKKKSTMVELVQELENIIPLGDSRKIAYFNETIEEAKRGEYHDYKNKKYACGKVAVVARLRYMNLHALAQRVINGEFDEEADAEDIAYLKSVAPKNLWPILGLE